MSNEVQSKNNNVVIIAVIAVVIAIVAIAITAAGGQTGIGSSHLTVISENSGAITVDAKDRATGAQAASIKVRGDAQLQVSPDISEGEIAVTFSDGNGTAFGAYTFDSKDSKTKTFDVKDGDVKVQINAKGAVGTLRVDEVVVLDGPGTPGS